MLWLALSALISAATPVPVEKGTLRLQDAVDLSTLVCIGTVTKVDTVTLPADWAASRTDALQPDDGRSPKEARFGRIQVERVLKGDPATKVAYHEAWTTWTCDTTSGHEGERCLFFLRPSRVAAAGPEIRSVVSTALGGAPVLRNVGSGSGVVPILLRDGEQCVQFFGAPESLWMEGAKYHQRLAVMTPYIEALARFAPELTVLHATSRPDWESNRKGFDYRVLADGGLRLATSGGDILRVSTFDEASWRALRGSLATLAGAEPISFGAPDTYNPYRILRIALPGSKITFVDDESVIVSGMEDEELARYRRVIGAWELVREVMDCPDCVDHRARDAELLRR